MSQFTFYGEGYDERFDKDRLITQLQRVYHLMRDGKGRTLSEICSELSRRYPNRFPEASISADLRSFRNEKHGSSILERHNEGHGLFLYRLIPSPKTEELFARRF
tara:strand:+ start:354 stop:668 length:315 start_codon:yes stop_codon:yes gene_type:complete